MALSQKQQGHLIMLIVMTFFGLNIPINKYLYATGMLTPIAVTALRMSFASAVFWLVSLFLPKEKIARKDMYLILLGGLLGMALNQGLFAYGLSRTSPVDASIITTSGPLFAMIMAAIILKEPITSKKIGGVLIGGVGAIILVYTSTQASTAQASVGGNLAILGAQMFYATYLVVTRPLAEKYSSITLVKWMFLVAAVLILPFGFSDIVNAPLFQQSNKEPFIALAFVLIGATCFTYMMIPFAQRRIRPTTISMYNNLQPLIASGVAIYIGMDHFSFTKVLAAILIFGGVYLVTVSKSKADVDAEKLVEVK